MNCINGQRFDMFAVFELNQCDALLIVHMTNIDGYGFINEIHVIGYPIDGHMRWRANIFDGTDLLAAICPIEFVQSVAIFNGEVE